MTGEKLKNIFAIGETVAVEFKRCSSGIEPDTYETVCSFLNRYGGDIFLGVEDNGEICGVPANAASDIIKNFISMINNPDILSPTFYLTPEILQYKGKTIIHIHIPVSSEVHSYKKSIYDRNNEADVKVTATGQIAAMYIRKQNVFTEQKVYPYVRDDELRFDMMPRLRQMAKNRHNEHPWNNMTDKEIIMSAKLYGEDKETGKRGYNLAAVMLLGTDLKKKAY
ncbi:MAG: putative DNA binding domain-containing protein [Oscillospiraceae bacterium]|nr:putative DNA binding domain-containing protein [Oscillospiraceae bacterium]